MVAWNSLYKSPPVYCGQVYSCSVIKMWGWGFAFIFTFFTYFWHANTLSSMLLFILATYIVHSLIELFSYCRDTNRPTKCYCEC